MKSPEESVGANPSTPPPAAQNSLSSWMKWGAKLSISLFLVYLYGRSAKWDQVASVFFTANVPLILLGMALTYVNLFIGTFRWWMLLESFHGGVSYPLILRLSLAGMFFNTFTPGGVGGDVIRGLQGGRIGISNTDCISSVITDRILGFVSLVALSALGVVLSWRVLFETGFMKYLALIIAATLVAIPVFYSHRVSRFLGKFPVFANRLRDRLSGVSRSLRRYRDNPVVVVKGFAVSVLSSLLMVTSFYVLALSIGSTTGFFYFLIFIPIIGVISMIPLTIGGIGIREAAYVSFFPLVGMPSAQAMGAGLLVSLMIVVVSMTAGMVMLLPGAKGETRTFASQS